STVISLDNAADIKQIAAFEGQKGPVYSLAWSPDGRLLAVPSKDEVWIWDTAAGKGIAKRTGDTNFIWGLKWVPDGENLDSSSEDHTIRLWHVAESGELSEQMVLDVGMLVFAVAWSHDGAKLASANQNGSVDIWDGKTGEKLAQFNEHHSEVISLAWSPDDH